MGVSGKYRAMIGWSTSETGLYIFDLIPMLRFICTISSLKIKIVELDGPDLTAGPRLPECDS